MVGKFVGVVIMWFEKRSKMRVIEDEAICREVSLHFHKVEWWMRENDTRWTSWGGESCWLWVGGIKVYPLHTRLDLNLINFPILTRFKVLECDWSLESLRRRRGGGEWALGMVKMWTRMIYWGVVKLLIPSKKQRTESVGREGDNANSWGNDLCVFW